MKFSSRFPVARAIENYRAAEPAEVTARASMLKLLDVATDPTVFGRGLVGEPDWWGHFTGSAWIVNPEMTHVVLVHHLKLNKWLQPGGHCEENPAILDVAMREALEETGLVVSPQGDGIFDLDVHAIPQWKETPAHWHYDVRYLLTAPRGQEPVVSHESHAVRWVSLEEAEELNPEESVVRMIRKTRGQKI